MTMPLIPASAPKVPARRWATAVTSYLPLQEDGDGEATRWLAGISFAPSGCDRLVGSVIDPICDNTPAESTSNLSWPSGESGDGCVNFEPFEVDIQIEEALTSGPSLEEIRQRLRDQADLAASYIIAREAFNGALTTLSPSLSGEADTVTGLDVTVLGALGAVEDGLASKLANGVGMIHVTPGVMTVIENRGNGLVFQDDTFYTPTGHIVVADAGYTGGAPSTGTPPAGASWIYGSSPVEYAVTEPNIYEGFDRTRNRVTLRYLQMAIVKFEPCSVVAALANST